MKILIVRLSSIGDCVLASPVVEALRARYPQAHITWAVRPKSKAMVEQLPGLDDWIIWDDRQRPRGLLQALARTRQQQFDVVLDLHGSYRSAAFLLASRAPRRITGSRANWLAIGTSTERVPETESLHARLFYLRRAAALNIAPDSCARFYPRVPVRPEHQEAACCFLRDAGVQPQHRLIGLNLGASKPRNRWPAERFAALTQLLLHEDNTRVVVFGAPADAPLEAAYQAALGSVRPGLVTSAVSRLNLLQLGAVAPRCAAFITADTGPMHIAAAVGAPVLALFGPADFHRTGPVHKPGNPPIRVLDARQCTGSWPAPMEALTVEAVAEAALQLCAR